MKILVNPPVPDLVFERGLLHFDGYGNYPLLSESDREAVLRLKLNRLAEKGKDALLVAGIDEAGAVIGLLAADLFDWGSRHFGFGMAHLQTMLVSGVVREREARFQMFARLFAEYEAWRPQHAVAHTALRALSEDLPLIHFLEDRGFRMMDTMTTYVFNRHEHHRIAKGRAFFSPRPYRENDREPVLALAQGSFSSTRFSNDPAMTREGLSSFYREWGEKLCAGEMADTLLIAQNEEQAVVGFLGFRCDQAVLNATGKRFMGGGLGAVSPAAPGAYPALLNHAISLGAAENHDLAEFETQVQNSTVIRVWHALKCRQVKVSHTFHQYLPL